MSDRLPLHDSCHRRSSRARDGRSSSTAAGTRPAPWAGTPDRSYRWASRRRYAVSSPLRVRRGALDRQARRLAAGRRRGSRRATGSGSRPPRSPGGAAGPPRRGSRPRRRPACARLRSRRRSATRSGRRGRRRRCRPPRPSRRPPPATRAAPRPTGMEGRSRTETSSDEPGGSSHDAAQTAAARRLMAGDQDAPLRRARVGVGHQVRVRRAGRLDVPGGIRRQACRVGGLGDAMLREHRGFDLLAADPVGTARRDEESDYHRRGAAHPDREPRRDRRPRDPHVPRAGHPDASPSTPRPTATRCTSRWPTRRTCWARRPRPSPT